MRADISAKDTNEFINCKYHGGNTEINITYFPLNMLECYNKVKNVSLYKTESILLEIFITSLSHTICINKDNAHIYQNTVDDIVGLITTTNNIIELLVVPLRIICLDLLKTNRNVLLNPNIRCRKNPLLNIKGDCDVVINNTLYDLKCTVGNNYIAQMLQLLGYASLINCNPELQRKIDTVSIVNLLQGTIVHYNISSINDNQMIEYLKILTRYK
jgi:hypothetical protein